MQDLEIYIRDLEPSRLEEWLSNHVDKLTLEARGAALKGRCLYRSTPVLISLYKGIYGKRFASMVMEGDELPWHSDLDCARSAWNALKTEIRCSPGDWQEGDAVVEEQWWRIDERGEQKVAF